MPAEGVNASDDSWIVGAFDVSVPVIIADGAAVASAAEADRQLAMNTAEAGDCESAWRAWKNATRHGPFRKAWIAKHEGAVRTAMARCYAQRASGIDGKAAKADTLLKGMKWDYKEPSLLQQSRTLAEFMEDRGDKQWAAKKINKAYVSFKYSIELDPRRSWARRKAEDVRDLRLRITRPGRKKKPTTKPKRTPKG